MTTERIMAESVRSERRFFGGMAIAIALIVVAGFARSYYLRPVMDPPPVLAQRPLTPLIHIHAFLFSGWIVLLFAQTRLVAAKRIDFHRRVGLAWAALAVAMIAVGTLVALHGVVRGVSPGGIEPRRFLALPLFAVLMFAVLVALAYRQRRNPQAHKRLMLLGTIALLPPVLARWLIFTLGFGPPAVLAASTLLVVPLIVFDLAKRRSLHSATLWGGLLLVLSGPLRLAIACTDAWVGFADWAVALIK